MTTKEKSPRKPPHLPPGAEPLLAKEQICALINYSPRSFDSLLSSGGYPPADLALNRFPRWRVETHNGWVRDQAAKHREGR